MEQNKAWGAAKTNSASVRGDFVGWFDSDGFFNEDSCLDALGLLWRSFEYLRVFLNEEGNLSLRRQNHCQLARYPGDGISAYPKHVDSFRDARGTNREITAIIYLNEKWTSEDGGCLRVWDGDQSFDIRPEFNRLVLFRSNAVLHEVLPSFKTRHAATAWYFDGSSKASTLRQFLKNMN